MFSYLSSLRILLITTDRWHVNFQCEIIIVCCESKISNLRVRCEMLFCRWRKSPKSGIGPPGQCIILMSHPGGWRQLLGLVLVLLSLHRHNFILIPAPHHPPIWSQVQAPTHLPRPTYSEVTCSIYLSISGKRKFGFIHYLECRCSFI